MRIEQLVRFSMQGSARQGTMRGGCLGLETSVHLETDETPERVREIVRMGEQTCFTLQALLEPVPVETTVVLNGERLTEGGTERPSM